MSYRKGCYKLKLKEATEEESQNITEKEQLQEFEFMRKELLDKLEYTRMLYQEQYDRIDKRLENRNSKMWGSIALFMVVAMVDIIFTIIISAPGGAILGLAWEIWAAAVFLFIAIIKTGKDMLKNIFAYLIHTEKSFLKKYILKYDIFTIKAEARYCSDKLSEVSRFINELKELKPDMPYKIYSECEYVRRYADEDVYELFYIYRPILIIIGAIFSVVFFFI